MEWSRRESTPQQTERGAKSWQARKEGAPAAAATSHSGVKFIACLPVWPSMPQPHMQIVTITVLSMRRIFKLKESLPKISTLNDICACRASEHSHLCPQKTEPTGCIQIWKHTLRCCCCFFPGTYTKIAAACHFRNRVICQAWAMERLHPPPLPRHPFWLLHFLDPLCPPSTASLNMWCTLQIHTGLS